MTGSKAITVPSGPVGARGDGGMECSMEDTKRIRTRAKRSGKTAPIGGIFLALALVGLVAVVIWSVDFTKGFLDNSAEVERFEKFIAPVVMMDPVPFNRIENAEENLILQSSLWAALLGDNRANYTYDEMGMLLVPASDVEVAAHSLFGPYVTVTHRTFDDNDASYMYDPEIGAYRVPLVAKIAYSPKVEELTKKGDAITLKVGYVAPGNVWSSQQQTETGEPVPDKFMLYELLKGENGYYIGAVKDTEDNILNPIS